MAQSMPILNKTFKAGGDLSSNQFHIVYLSAAQTVSLAGANARAIGVLQNTPNTAGLGAVVRLAGTTKMVVDGTVAIAAGDPLKADASGHGVKGAAAKDRVVGIALDASTAAGDIIEVLICLYDVNV